jgi:methionine-rich copper-binding protein CopC
MIKQTLAVYALMIVAACQLSAHAILLEARPGANAAVAGPDVTVQLRFNSRIDASRSRVTLVFPDQRERVLKLDPQASPATLASEVTGLARGAYKLRWQVLAADGHITRGEVPFEVK